MTYASLVASMRSHKTETHRVRVTVGCEKLNFCGITTTNCASLTTKKCLLNSVVLTPDARFMTLDIKKKLQYPNGKVRIYENCAGKYP